MKKQQEIILKTDSLSLQINTGTKNNPILENKEPKTPQLGRKLSIKSKLIEKQIEINIVNSIDEDTSSPRTLAPLSLTNSPARSHSKSPSKESKLFDFDNSKINSPRKSYQNDSRSPLLPQLSTCASTIYFPDVETPTVIRSPCNKKYTSVSSSPRMVPEKSPFRDPGEEKSLNLKKLCKKLQLSPTRCKTQADESSGFGFIDIFQSRNHQKTPRTLNYGLSKADKTEFLENEGFPSNVHTPRGKHLISGKKLVLMKISERSRNSSKGSMIFQKGLPTSCETLTDFYSSEHSIFKGDNRRTVSNKGSISARKLNLDLESIQRIEHEFVESNQLLSTRMSDSKISKTKHNMFRAFKGN